VAKVKSYEAENPLVLCSGNILNPSTLSTLTKGSHVVDILNGAGVKAACLGNHDLDFGISNLEAIMQKSECQWLCSNVTHKESGDPLCNTQKYTMLEHGGRMIGVMGLVEEEWLDALPCVDRETVVYKDFVEVAQTLADELKDVGAEIVIALTHFKNENDLKLLEAVEDIELVLGGHEHDYSVNENSEHGRWAVKSGKEFRTLSRIEVGFDGVGDSAAHIQTIEKIEVNGEDYQDVEIEDAVFEAYEAFKASSGKVLAQLGVDLDAKTSTMRTEETNCGNWCADVLRVACDADIALVPSEMFKADDTFPSGSGFTLGNLQRLVPFMESLTVMSLDGAAILQCLENSVSCWPQPDARFAQVSGLRFSFDPNQELGSKIVPGSVTVDGAPLNMNQAYTVATLESTSKGQDGYDAMLQGSVAKSSRVLSYLPTMLRNHISMINTASALQTVKFAHWRQESINLALASGCAVSRKASKEKKFPTQADWEGVQISPVKDGRIMRVGA